jgi:hypothetical protein
VDVGTNGDDLTGLDVTAISQLPGRATAEIMLDEDGYAEIRWYTNPAAAADDVTAAITRILAAVAATASVLAPTPLHECGLLDQLRDLGLLPPARAPLPPGASAGLLQA